MRSRVVALLLTGLTLFATACDSSGAGGSGGATEEGTQGAGGAGAGTNESGGGLYGSEEPSS